MAEKGADKAPGAFSLLGTASTMGLHMVSGPVVGGGLGWLIDHWLDSWPIASSIGFVLGLAAGFRNVWADARYLERSNAVIDAEKKRKEEGKAAQPAEAVAKKPELPAASTAPREEAAAPLAEDLRDDWESSRDAPSASILAGTVSPEEQGLEELDETMEAIRRVLEGEPQKGGHRGGDDSAGKGQA